MTDKKDEIKIVFDPGCFDHMEFESQEELDSLVNEIKNMFEGKTHEEIKAMSKPVDMDELMAEDPELAAHLLEQFENIDNPDKRTLQ